MCVCVCVCVCLFSVTKCVCVMCSADVTFRFCIARAHLRAKTPSGSAGTSMASKSMLHVDAEHPRASRGRLRVGRVLVEDPANFP